MVQSETKRNKPKIVQSLKKAIQNSLLSENHAHFTKLFAQFNLFSLKHASFRLFSITARLLNSFFRFDFCSFHFMRRESSRDTHYYLQGICPGPYRLPGRGQPALRASADLHPPRPDPLHIHHLPLSGPGPTGRRIHLPRQEVYVHTVCSVVYGFKIDRSMQKRLKNLFFILF